MRGISTEWKYAPLGNLTVYLGEEDREAQPGKESVRGLDGCRKVRRDPRGWGAAEWPRGESWGVAISKGPRVGRSTHPVKDW